MSIKNWSVVPGNNTSAPPAGAPESSTKLKDMNDILREMMAKVRCLAAPATVASAATTDLGAVDETWLTVSGTTTITSLGTVSAGIYKFVTFSGALTLTHNATSLILLTGANRATAAGDCALYQSLGGGNWKEYFYHPIGSVPVFVNTFSGANQSLASPGFQCLPGGVIIQSGVTLAVANGVGTTITLPLAFPAAFMGLACSHWGTDSTVNVVGIGSGLTGITLTHSYTSDTSAISISWVAIGY